MPPDQENVSIRNHRFVTELVLAVLTLFVTGLLGWWAATTGLCNDELLFLRAIELGPVDGLMAEGSSHPPLFRWLVGPIINSSTPDWLLRVPPILCVIGTIFIWSSIYRRLFDSPWVSAAVLLLTAGSIHWLEAGYLLLPYAMLTMLGSAHALFWLRLVECQSRTNVAGFTLSGAATIWVHFYGANLLLADQIIWLCLVLQNRKLFRYWLATSLGSFLIVAPVIPVAWFYIQVEKPFALVEISNFGDYFITFSQQFFSSLTFNVKFLGLLILVWYAFAVMGFIQFFSSGNSTEKKHTRPANQKQAQWLVIAGLFLAGFPAAQAHSLVFEKAMWPRYAIVASWTHWPLLFVALQKLRVSNPRMLFIALIGAGVALFGFVNKEGLRPDVAFSYSNEVRTLKERAKPTDGFLVQDFDFWIGPSNGDRLWFERYSPVEMQLFSGQPKTRFEIYNDGVEFESVPESVNRFWIYSGLFNEKLLNSNISPEWKLAFVEFGDCPWFPLAMFERVDRVSVESETRKTRD